MQARPLVEATGLEYEAGGRRILDVDRIEAWPGEVVLVRGPSGSGKTTLLSMLGALLTPTAGMLTYGGETVSWRRPRLLARIRRDRVGFVFQRDRLLDPLTAAENVAVACELGGRADPERVAALLRRVGLASRGATAARKLSGGERQRVAVARALANEPTIVLADEPTASLDTHNVELVADLLAGAAADAGRAVIVATHDDRLTRIATRVLTLDDGRLASQWP